MQTESDVSDTSSLIDPPKDMPCLKCLGCGKIADTSDAEPWSAWENLPPGSDIAVKLGIVKPIPCPECGGSGWVDAPGIMY